MPQRPLISLCMIAKDERLWLPRSLASAAPWVDEMVVLDTGSSDGSQQLARDLGARVVQGQWEGDFAKARNQAMAQARGRWLLIMDADEELDQTTGPNLRPCVQMVDGPCLMVRINHLARDGSASWQLTPRLIRADDGPRFVGRIHEALEGHGKALAAPITLIHHGFAQSPEVCAAKARRNQELIGQWIDQEPTNFSAWAYLAQSLMAGAGDPAETLWAARQALELGLAGGAPPSQLTRAYHPLLMALTSLGRHEELIEAANQCLTLLPDYPDPLYSLSWAFFKLGRWSSVCRQCRRFAQCQDHWQANPLAYPYPHNLSAGVLPEALARWTLAAARLGRTDEVAEAFGRLLAQPRGQAAARLTLAEIARDHPAALAQRLAAMATRQRPEWF